MAIPLKLSPAQEDRLKSEAQRLGLSPEDLAQVAVEDLLERSADFDQAAEYVVAKNRELYKRLS